MAKQRRYSKALTLISKSVNEKGRIKGKNKKDKKIKKATCPHHRINKKGRVKPTIYVDGKECICEMCKKRFPAKFYSDDKMDEVVDEFERLNEQQKYLATAVNQNSDVCDYFSEVSVHLIGYKKNAKKIRNLAKKQSDIKKKKKDSRYSGSRAYGDWATKR